MTIWHLTSNGWFCCVLVLSCSFFWVLCLICILFIAYLGYLHLSSTSSRCCNSSSSSLGLEQTALVLWVRVLITFYLATKFWWLSHWRYYSVCVGFLYTSVNQVLFVSGVIIVSRKGFEPVGLVSTAVNWMEGAAALMWCKSYSLLICCCTTEISSTSFPDPRWVLKCSYASAF